MRLYKNVDICDLDSILEKGLLSLDECKNNNWNEGSRAKNDTSVVYMFKPIGLENSFSQYGAALLEIELADECVKENEIGERDVNKGKYIEYITQKVEPQHIINIYIPELFKDRLHLSGKVLLKTTFCKMTANHYQKNTHQFCAAAQEVLEQFAKTARIESTEDFNFFYGMYEDREIIDLYDLHYEI